MVDVYNYSVYQPDGPTGPAYQLDQVISWYTPSPNPDSVVLVVFDTYGITLGEDMPEASQIRLRFDKDDFESAYQVFVNDPVVDNMASEDDTNMLTEDGALMVLEG